MGAGAQNQRPGQSEVGEEHLALLLKDDLVPGILNLNRYIFQGQPLHCGAKILFGHQRHQGGSGGNHRMAQGLRNAVAVPGGAGQRIGDAASGKDNRLTWKPTPLRRHAGDGPTLRQEGFRPLLRDIHARAAQAHEEGVDNVGRPVRRGENPAAPLRLEGHPQPGEELLHR